MSFIKIITANPTSGRRSAMKHWALMSLLAGLLVAPSSGMAFDFWGLFGDDDAKKSQAEITEAMAKPLPVDQPHPVVDPAYGDALFDFHQQRYFSAITKLLVAKQQNELTYNKEHAELLLGSLYVAYGMLDVGEAIFMAYLDENATVQGADEAWFQLANIYYRKGDQSKALRILSQRLRQPLEDRTTEQLLLQMLCHMMLGQADEANYLSGFLDVKKSKSLFVQFNLGASYGMLGEQEKANRYYQSIISSTARTASELALQDQASVALGIQQYRAGDFTLAQQTLSRVRLHGPSANQALLAMGWSQFKNGQQLDALTPWMELANRPLSSPAVQEAVLNVPRTFESLGALQDALDGYKEAYKIYRKQRRDLESIKSEIMGPGWIEAISPVQDKLTNPLDSIPGFNLPVDNLASQHLLEYFASNQFQGAYRNYRELQRLYLVLHYWKKQLPSFNDMVATHLNRLNKIVPIAALKAQEANQLRAESQKRLAELQSRLQSIIDNDDLVGLANPTQKSQYDRMEAVKALLVQANDRETYRLEWEKLELLQGLLLWDLNASAVAKRWQSTKDLAASEQLLQELEQSIGRVVQARSAQMNRFHGFNQRTKAIEANIETLQEQTRLLLVAQRQQIQSIAIGIIEKQQDKLNSYRARSLLSIARLQDLAYTQERQRQKQKDKSIIFELGEELPVDTTSSSEESQQKPTVKQPQKPVNNLFDVIQQIFKGED